MCSCANDREGTGRESPTRTTAGPKTPWLMLRVQLGVWVTSTAVAQADELKSKRILLGVGFLTNEPEDVLGVHAHGSDAGRRRLLGHLDHLPRCRRRIEPTPL